jgi:hypothetical protein
LVIKNYLQDTQELLENLKDDVKELKEMMIEFVKAKSKFII